MIKLKMPFYRIKQQNFVDFKFDLLNYALYKRWCILQESVNFYDLMR